MSIRDFLVALLLLEWDVAFGGCWRALVDYVKADDLTPPVLPELVPDDVSGVTYPRCRLSACRGIKPLPQRQYVPL